MTLFLVTLIFFTIFVWKKILLLQWFISLVSSGSGQEISGPDPAGQNSPDPQPWHSLCTEKGIPLLALIGDSDSALNFDIIPDLYMVEKFHSFFKTVNYITYSLNTNQIIWSVSLIKIQTFRLELSLELFLYLSKGIRILCIVYVPLLVIASKRPNSDTRKRFMSKTRFTFFMGFSL